MSDTAGKDQANQERAKLMAAALVRAIVNSVEPSPSPVSPTKSPADSEGNNNNSSAPIQSPVNSAENNESTPSGEIGDAHTLPTTSSTATSTQPPTTDPTSSLYFPRTPPALYSKLTKATKYCLFGEPKPFANDMLFFGISPSSNQSKPTVALGDYVCSTPTSKPTAQDMQKVANINAYVCVGVLKDGRDGHYSYLLADFNKHCLWTAKVSGVCVTFESHALAQAERKRRFAEKHPGREGKEEEYMWCTKEEMKLAGDMCVRGANSEVAISSLDGNTKSRRQHAGVSIDGNTPTTGRQLRDRKKKEDKQGRKEGEEEEEYGEDEEKPKKKQKKPTKEEKDNSAEIDALKKLVATLIAKIDAPKKKTVKKEDKKAVEKAEGIAARVQAASLRATPIPATVVDPPSDPLAAFLSASSSSTSIAPSPSCGLVQQMRLISARANMAERQLQENLARERADRLLAYQQAQADRRAIADAAARKELGFDFFF